MSFKLCTWPFLEPGPEWRAGGGVPAAVRGAGCSGHWEEAAPRGIWKCQLRVSSSGRSLATPEGREGGLRAQVPHFLCPPQPQTHLRRQVYRAEPQHCPPPGGRSGPTAGMTSRSCSPSAHLGGPLPLTLRTRRPHPPPQIRLSLPLEQMNFERAPSPKSHRGRLSPTLSSISCWRPEKWPKAQETRLETPGSMAHPFPLTSSCKRCRLRSGCLC